MPETPPKPVAPCIHLNGSSPAQLMKGLRDAAESVQRSMDFVAATRPHGRDYYVLPDGDAALKQAVAQHEDRLARLRSVYDELFEIYQLVGDQADAEPEGRNV